MWIIYTIILHILLLGSIFVIYFRSPVITNLHPLENIPLEAPAKRLVLFVTDGLRAESFYHNNFINVPHIRELIDTKPGIYGISKTQVPTESRPGHIALIAGLHEDPSAVMRGWKENPIDFDTVFNRSSKTYAWGANDVLHIFSRLGTINENRLFFDSYNHELDFSGTEKTYELDNWVFDKVEKLLKRKSHELQEEKQVIYFLHLLGLDTAGHVHKPNTELFLENLHFTERGIKDMYDLFENTFPDGKTAYILTSDHGMTNAGSHGAGDTFETETPFFIWGAGINGKPFANENHPPASLYEIEQVQLTPLMSSLLGIYPPMNNFGVLPKNFINASEEYIFYATHNNALQLYLQYKALLEQHEKGAFTILMPKFPISFEYDKDSKEFKDNYKMAINDSYQLMYTSLEGIEYYFSYYKGILLFATSATFIGWLGYLLKLLGDEIGLNKLVKSKKHVYQQLKYMVLYMMGFLMLIFCFLQKLPWAITFYLLMPLVTWTMFFNHNGPVVLSGPKLGFMKINLLLLLLCAELLVYTFFERRAISLGFLLFSVHDKLTKGLFRQNFKYYISFVLSIVLIVFPLLPISVGYSNNILLCCGIFLTFLRPYVVKNRLSRFDRYTIMVALLNALACIYMHTNQIGIFLINQVISWSFLGYVLFSLMKPSSLAIKHKLEKFIFILTSLYALLCTSYESLFVLLLISELIFAMDSSKFSRELQPPFTSPYVQLFQCFRLAFIILLYTLFSFFGTGNIASVSSFDPNIIRCFITTFSPFVIMFLVILKLIIPILLIVAIIFALSPMALHFEKTIFICLLLICDIMCLNFLFLVKNKGSWLEIGSSISHFVIMQVTTVVLILIVNLAKFFLKIYSVKIN